MSAEEGSKSDATSGISEASTFAFTSSAEAESFPFEDSSPSFNQGNTSSSKSSIPDNSDQFGDDQASARAEAKSNLSIPKSSQQDSEQQSEWNLLTSKLVSWLEENKLPTEVNLLIKPGLLILGIIALTVFLKVYGNILNAISQVPLAPRLFEFVGLIWLFKFSSTKLIRSENRQEFFSELKNQWEIFLGRPHNHN